MPEKLNREHVRQEAERIDMLDESIDHKVKGVDDKLAGKYTSDTITLADKIERSEIHEEDKQQLLKEIKTELSTLKTKRSLKKREKDFNKKLDSWINEVESGEKLREELRKYVNENQKYLPMAKIAIIGSKDITTEELKAIKEEIEANKNDYKKFQEIQKMLPKELDQAFLDICFIKYLDENKEPKIEDIIKGLKEVKVKQEKILEVQKETILLTKKLRDIKQLESEETMSLEQQELVTVLVEMLNTKDVGSSIKELELDEALKQAKRNQEKLKMTIKIIEAEEEMRAAKEKKDILEKQLTYFKLIKKQLEENVKDAGKSFSKLLKETNDKGEQEFYLAQLIAIQEDAKAKSGTIQKQIDNVDFALNNLEAEDQYIKELIDANKAFSKEAKEFAKRKSEFLGEKIKDLEEREEKIKKETNRIIAQLKKGNLTEERKDELRGRDHELLVEEMRIKVEKKYFELEQKAAKNKFDPREWLAFIKENKRRNPDLAKTARIGISLYTPRYLKRHEAIKKVNNNLLPLHQNLGRIYGLLDSAGDRNLSQEVLDDWNKTLGDAKDEFLKEEMWIDVQNGGAEILSLIELFKANGLNQLDPIMGTLTQMQSNYKSLQSLYGHDQSELVRITDKISQLEADTTWNGIKHFAKTEGLIIGGAVVGATLFAIPGGQFAGAVALGGVSKFILVSACAGVGMTLGTEIAKPFAGFTPDFSIENLAYSSARNTLMSMAFMGAGRFVGGELGAVLRSGTGGRVANGVNWVKNGIDKGLGKIAGAGGGATNRCAMGRYMAGHMFQETGEELAENWAEKTHPLLGIMASTFNAMDGVNVNVDVSSSPALRVLSQEAEVSIKSVKNNNVTFEYNPENKQFILDTISQNGGTLVNQGSVLVCEFYQGREKITYKFLPSTVPFEARQFLATDFGKSLNEKFKVKFKNNLEAEFEGSTTRFRAILEAEGYVCLELEGKIIAAKNNQRILFRPAKNPTTEIGRYKRDLGELAQRGRRMILSPVSQTRNMSRAHSGNENTLLSIAAEVPASVMEEAQVAAAAAVGGIVNTPGITNQRKQQLIRRAFVAAETDTTVDTTAETTIDRSKLVARAPAITPDMSVGQIKAIEFVYNIDTQKKIDRIFEGLEGVPAETQTELREYIEELALAQHEKNPEQYVSHGFDHSLSVMGHTENAMESDPEIVQTMMSKYGITEVESKFMMRMVAVFHDFGYPDVGDLGKALHGVTGALIAAKPKFIKMMEEILVKNPADKAKFEILMQDFQDAILYHSADKVEIHRDTKIKLKRGEFIINSENIIEIVRELKRNKDFPTDVIEIHCSESNIAKMQKLLVEEGHSLDNIKFVPVEEGAKFKGRRVDLAKKNDKLLGIEFKEASLQNDPLNYMIRVADNVDMVKDRVSPFQATEIFKQIYRDFGPGTDTGLVLVELEDCKDLKALLKIKTIREKLAEYGVNTNQDAKGIIKDFKRAMIQKRINDPKYASEVEQYRDKIPKIGMMTNSQSVRHFGGCESVVDVRLKGAVLTVQVDLETYNELNKIKVIEEALDADGVTNKVRVGVGDYQIWRAYEAYRSLKNNGENISIRIVTGEGSNQRVLNQNYKPESV